MAVVNIPIARALMMRGDRMRILRHGKKIVVFPDWRNMSQQYSGSLSMEWGGLSESQTYENNYLTWIEPWETKPTIPVGETVPREVPFPPIYMLNMSGQHYSSIEGGMVDWSSDEFTSAVDLYESTFGVQFFRYEDQKCAWAFAQGVGQSASEKVAPGYLCCSYELRKDDFDGAEKLCGSDGSCFVAVALSVSDRALFSFRDGVLWTAFDLSTLGHDKDDPAKGAEENHAFHEEWRDAVPGQNYAIGQISLNPDTGTWGYTERIDDGPDGSTTTSTVCEGIKLYHRDGSEFVFPHETEDSETRTRPSVPVLIEIRTLIPQSPPMFNSLRLKRGGKTRQTDDIPGVLANVSGKPFVTASF